MPSRFVTRLLPAVLAALPLLAAAAPRDGSAPAAGGKTELTWYGHATFILRTPGGTVLAVDPWFGNPKSPDKDAISKLEKVDYILVTHGHSDHSGDAVALGQKTGAKLIGQADLGRALVRLGFPEKQATLETLGNSGGVIQAGDATIAFVPAVHSSEVVNPETKQSSTAGTPLGFVVRVKGGPTFYFTGDTDLTSDMRQIPERWGRIDYLVACIGGHFTLDPAAAAMAAGYVKAKTVIPMHFGTFPLLKGTPKELEAALHGRAKVLQMTVGETQAF